MMIVVLLMSSCLFLFVSYQLYLRLLVEKLDSEDKIKKQAIKKTALNQFTWKQAVSAESAAVLTNYELQLAREWRPYLGETSITMIRSEKTQTLTLSVFSVGLSYHEFQTGQDNIVALIAALNSVKEITMIDFNFTYRDQEQTLVKSIDTYARETLETNLEPVVIS